MADRNRELAPDNWSLVRERALIKRKRKHECLINVQNNELYQHILGGAVIKILEHGEVYRT